MHEAFSRIEAFSRVVDELCDLARFDDRERILMGEAIEVNGVECAVLYIPEVSRELAFVCVDFGEPPAVDKAVILEVLLQENYVAFSGKGPAFAISPANGHVVYLEHLPLVEATGAQLLQLLTRLSAKAAEWRTSRFLDAAAPEPNLNPSAVV